MRLIAALAAILAAIVVVVVPQQNQAQADAGGRGGDFVSFTSQRVVLDTRSGAIKPAGTVTTFQLLGVGGIPATGVSAVLVKLTAIGPPAATYITLYPEGTARPNVAMVNVAAGETLSNTAIVRPAANGKVTAFNQTATHYLVEAQGYFTTSTGSTWGGLVPVTHARVIDTRTGLGTTKATIPANGSRTVNLAVAGVPAGATAVFAGITIPSGTTAPGWYVATPGAAAGSGLPVINFENGVNSASGTAIPLAADGRVTFTNKGSAATDLIIDTLAYFTRTATAGAGLRPLTSRLFGGTVAANAVVDVVVGGTNGMPLRGMAGAALSLQAGGSTYGALRVWPTGATEPVTSLTQHGVNTTHRSSTIVKPGTDGKVRIKNISAAAITLFVDLEGWFADPLPASPVAQHSSVSAQQAIPTGGQSLGTMEYAYTDDIGRVVIGHQTDLGSFNSVQYTVISGNEAFSGRPALTARSDGTVQAAVQYTDGDIWTTGQTASGAATWQPWSDLGGSMATPPVAAVLSTGTTVLFAVDVNGALWSYAQTGSVPFWRNLGDVNLTATPAAVLVRDGVQIFARTDTGAIMTILYRTDGTISPWTDLGGTGAGTPSVVVYPGFRLRVVTSAADGTIQTKLQDPNDGTFPATWSPLGTFVGVGAPSAILDPVLGRTAVVARASDGLVYTSYETATGSGEFGDWTLVNNSSNLAVTDPTVALFTNGSNQTWIIMYRSINGTVWIYDRQISPGVAFTATALPAP